MAQKKENNLPEYYFHQGTNTYAYDYMGAHFDEKKKVYTFRTWAPNADSVFLAGDFNGWGYSNPMIRESAGGIWYAELSENEFSEYSKYKFIVCRNGKNTYKSDPYAFFFEVPPKTSSVFCKNDFSWTDKHWMQRRRKVISAPSFSAPINIYEVHLGSWRKKDDGGYYTYREIAPLLCSYVKEMGYTHIELMPVAEHPYDGSWGYQVCGYFAPTSRFGTPYDFKYFVEYMHNAGVGVILDWVPAHFPKDEHGLYEFDGGPLYEYQGKDRMESKSWGTRRFDVGRCEVQSFLVSNALFWLREYHIDGIRVDAVASMLYLDFDKDPGEWIPNEDGGNDCREAVAFFRKLGDAISAEFPDVLFVAEESTSWKDVTKPAKVGGLGFNYKWNMGWMNDVLRYIKEDPIYRKYHQTKLTFSTMYMYDENFILPISHDEVVHGKKSLLDKAPGDYWQKFASTRAFLAYMMTHPGKKLLFMGCEIGQFCEWAYKKSIEWFLLEYEMHSKFKDFVKELNFTYLENKELWELDHEREGFRWVDADNCDLSLLSYIRYDKKGNFLLTILNFTPIPRYDLLFGVPKKGKFTELLNSDDTRFGGTGVLNHEIESAEISSNGLPYSLKLNIGPYGAIIIKYQGNKK